MPRFSLASLSLAAVCACASTPAAEAPPKERCVRHTVGGPARQLGIFHPARSEFNPLAPGSYRIEVEADSYRAVCQFELPEGGSLVSADSVSGDVCSGGQLNLMANSESVVGILVPARLVAMRVRVLRNRAPVFDGLVSASSPCPRFGLCVSMQGADGSEAEGEEIEQAE